MKLFEATVKRADGSVGPARVSANSAQAAMALLKQRYGASAVQYLPRMIPG
jgi:hypothetical protein